MARSQSIGCWRWCTAILVGCIASIAPDAPAAGPGERAPNSWTIVDGFRPEINALESWVRPKTGA